MGISAAEEKRQEEKRTKELREFQRANPANRRCFDCNEMMPQYICLDFNTFVCTSCSGIHREFAHRVKSLSMSKFTEAEVKAMKLGGNEAAQKYWRAKHDASFRPHGGTDGERSRNFIRLTYIDRKWVYESPRASKKDDTGKTSSGSSSRSKSSFTANSDDAFGSSTKSKSSSAAPAFDAFNSDSASATGFAQFGDFAAFGNGTSTTSGSSSASTGFADFGDFGNTTSSGSASTGFADFDDFSGSSASAPTPTPGPAPALRSDFGSFKIAPPPGASFSSSSSSNSGFSAPVAAPAATTTPVSPVAKTPNDFMAFSPEKVVKDPFGFDEPSVMAAPVVPTSSSSPFDAFGASPSPAASSSRRSSSSSFDAFGMSAPAPLSSSSSSAAGGFDAFGAASAAANPSLAFDAFGTSSSSSTAASPFDAFGASTAAPAPTPFDAFGTSSSTSGVFGGDFSASASVPTAAAAAVDPFSAFSPRVSSGSSKVSEPPAAPAADPFAAFDEVDAAPTASASTAAGSFGSSEVSPVDPFGSSASVTAAAPSAASDPFAFASNNTGGGSQRNSFTAPSGHQPNGAFAPGFGNAGANSFQPQQHRQQQGVHAMYNPMFMQQQQPGAPQGFPQQQQYHAGAMHSGQQQQRFGHPQQQQPGQFPHAQQQQMPHHHPGAPSHGMMPPTLPVHSKPAAETPAITDPFAALNIGLGTSSSAPSSSRGNSFELKKPGSASGSFSNGLGAGASTAAFSQNHQGSGSSANVFGGGAASAAFPAAAAPTGGSRGSSFETHQPPAPAFGAFAGAPMANASPMGSFAFAAPAAPASAMGFAAPSQSPMGSFTSTPAPQQPNAFTDNAFGAFASAPPRADSFTGASSSAAPANPFDMF